MTVWEMMHTPLYVLTETSALLLLMLQMALILASFRDGRSRKLRILYIAHFLIGFFGLFLPLYVFIRVVEKPESRVLPAWMIPCKDFSALILVLYELITVIVLIAAFTELRYYRKGHLTAESIKETMDLLPAGIAFGKADGTVVFSNIAMNELSRKLSGKGMSNLIDFHRKAELADSSTDSMGSVRGTADFLHESAGMAPETIGKRDKRQTVSDGTRTWQLITEEMDVDGEPMVQLTVTDITEQTEVAKELEEKNEKLRDIRMRLIIYNEQAGRMVIAQELLNARMAVHSEVGNVLLESRHYLEEPASFDEKMLLQVLKNVNTYLLREYEEDDTERDSLADALEMAETIGVDVSLTGIIPEKQLYRRMLAAAISECATNTVKHANGDRLWVNVQDQADHITFTIRNNGLQPKSRIRESGGLLSLRTLVENEQGTLRVESIPDFRLIIALPKNGE